MGASVWVWEVHNNQGASRTRSEPLVRGAQLQLLSIIASSKGAHEKQREMQSVSMGSLNGSGSVLVRLEWPGKACLRETHLR